MLGRHFIPWTFSRSQRNNPIRSRLSILLHDTEVHLQVKITGAEWIALIAVASQNIRPCVQGFQAAYTVEDAVCGRGAGGYWLAGVKTWIAEYSCSYDCVWVSLRISGNVGRRSYCSVDIVRRWGLVSQFLPLGYPSRLLRPDNQLARLALLLHL